MNDSSEIKLHFLDYWRVVKVRWAILTTAFLLVMITAGFTCYFVPREYLSKVKMEVKSDQTQFKIFSPEQGMQEQRDATLTPTTQQVIYSKDILYPVIDNLKLCDSWSTAGQKISREQAYQMLASPSKLQVKDIRNTDLLEIGVYSIDRQEAANIANTIAVVYIAKRKENQQAMLDSGLNKLDQEVIDHRKAVEIARSEAAQIRNEKGIIDPNPEQDIATDLETNNYKVDQQEVNDAKIKIAELRTQLDETAKLTPEQLMQALHALNLDDPVVSKIFPLYQDAASEEARLLNVGLGENHPRIKGLRAQKEVYSQQLNAQIAALRNSFATKLAVQEATATALEQKQNDTEETFQERRKQTAEYATAKSKYINAKHILEAAENRLAEQRMQGQMSLVPAKIWENAEASEHPARPNVAVYMGLAIVIGLVVGVGLAFFIEYLDTSVKTMDDVERLLGVPVLAVIPKGVASLLQDSGDSPDAEAYRILQTNVEFNRKNPSANTITVVSGGPGEGKSTTLNNLAYICARGGYRVLVVDADLRRPAQHRIFGVENSVGLVDYLTGDKQLNEVILSTKLPNLFFMPSGSLTQDAVGILNSGAMSELINKLKTSYDLVFFDSPPILGVSDASILASEVDITIMVVQYRRFPRDMLKRVKQAVLQVGGNLLGSVLNFVDTKHDSGYQYYTQYYDYYSVGVGGKKKTTKRQKKDGPHTPPTNGAARPEQSAQIHGDY